jgi:hypothetical protein
MKSHGMTSDLREQSPRRYFVDKNGRRVLIGLTIEETLEFERLDSLPALDDSGNHVAWDENGVPVTTWENGALWQTRPGMEAVDGRNLC